MNRQLTRPAIAALTASALALSMSAPSATAHHAFSAEFDGNAPVVLRGEITKVEWINPHAWIHLRVSEAGKPDVEWMVEGGTPNTLLREGVTREAVKPGIKIIVRGYQAKDKRCLPQCIANGRDVTLSDGRQLFMGSSGTGAPKDGRDSSER
ncbi:MAG: hypothetical protein JWM47_4492 [Acidimicrobiales bacterium]|nr:hypothetical protein [Acidimicrobiales bacterium]